MQNQSPKYHPKYDEPYEIMKIDKQYHSLVFIIFFCIMILLFPITGGGLFSQQRPIESPEELPVPGFTDEEIESFADVSMAIMLIQQEGHIAMIDKIEEQNLNIQRFNEILEARTTEQDPGISDEELDAFEIALEVVREIQEDIDNQISEEIDASRISRVKYEEILLYYQQDPELRKKVDEIIRELDHP